MKPLMRHITEAFQCAMQDKCNEMLSKILLLHDKVVTSVANETQGLNTQFT